MSELSEAIRDLAASLNRSQKNKNKIYSPIVTNSPPYKGMTVHPHDPIWVVNARGSEDFQNVGEDAHAVSMPHCLNEGDQTVIKMKAWIASYEAAKFDYYKGIDGDAVWQIATEADYASAREYLLANESASIKIRVWEQHLNKFADVASRVQIMGW